MSSQQELYEKLFSAAVTHFGSPTMHGEDLGKWAQDQALKLMPYARLPGGAPQSVPGLPELLSADPTSGGGLNPLVMMTKGWPQNEVIACMNAILTIVMGREYGRTVEQLSQEHAELISAIEALFVARMEAKSKKA
jgi:hypothetical protein